MEAVVTVEMVEDGLSEMAELRFSDDLVYVLECVFQQMFYAGRLSASTTNAERN